MDTKFVYLQLTVEVPADVPDEKVREAIDHALDEPGNYGNDWGNWTVGGVTLKYQDADGEPSESN